MKEISLQRAVESLEIETKAVADVLATLDKDAFAAAVDLLANADRIITSASGSSGVAAKKFAHTLCCVERPAQFLPPCEAMHGGLGAVQKDNVVVLVSRGGKTAELLPVLSVALEKNAKIIGVTENMESPLATQADIVLAMKVTKECDKYNCQGTTSFAVTNAIFDALQAAVIEYTGYQKMDFALIHPGGAVGKRLNAK